MAIPYWRKNRLAWDKPTLGGRVLPGTVTLAPFKFGLKVHEGDPSGKDGGKVIFQGLNLPRAVLTLEIDREEDFDAWNSLAPLILPVKQPQARDILAVYHPILARYGFNSCIVEDIEDTPPRNGGPEIVRLFLIVIFQRDNATHAPNKSATASKGGNAQTITLSSDVTRIKDVRDRPTAGGGRPTSP